MTTDQLVQAAAPVVELGARLLAPALTALEPVSRFVHAHPFAVAGAAFFGGGGLANLAARALNMLPLGPWHKAVRLAFSMLGAFGRTRFGAPVWRPFEQALKRLILDTADAAREGLDADDASPAAPAPGVPA